ncbi:hypothetical protein C1645_873898 [Glomus cerebriforme]|uniref:Myb-like domain-containing protein n=1 Tax=Glomus cerebriforme TaxID=658196 RepID=A0A397T5V7_9GLOM|nr:hypothetical protein C1645_873898 [Glomus cerebriforme]
MDKADIENKENAIENSLPPKFMLPSISNLPNPSPLTPFHQMNNHESADAILRGTSAQSTTFSNQNHPFESSIKQETNPSTPKFYLPNFSTTYDPMNTSYTTTYWPAYYSDYPYQSNRDINGLTGPPYNVSTWFATDNNSSTYNNNNNRQECLRSPFPTRSFTPYYNNNRHLPPLTPNLHSIDSIVNSSPSSHHLGYNSAFTYIHPRKSDIRDDQILKFDHQVIEGDNNLLELEGIKIQRASIKSDHSYTQENIDPGLLDLLSEETVKRGEDYDESNLLTPKTEGGKDKKKGRSNWSRKETRSLITAVKSKHKLLLAAQRNAEKSRIWSDMFSEHCTRYSGRTLKAFKLRWARLVADYNSVHECLKAGVEPMDFDFYDEMKEILVDEVIDGTSDITEGLTPVLKRKLDQEDEKIVGTSQIEEDLVDQLLVPQQSSQLHTPSPPRFVELKDEDETSDTPRQSKKFKVKVV